MSRASRLPSSLPLVMASALIVLLSPQSPAAETTRRLAVLEFAGQDVVGTSIVRQLADEARGGALDVLGGRPGYLIVTQESQEAILRDMGREPTCSGLECEVDIGQSLGADWVVTGSVAKVQKSYRLTVKAFDTNSRALLAMENVEAAGTLELVRAVRKVTATLVAKGLRLSPASSAPDAVGGAPSFGGGIEVRMPKVSLSASNAGFGNLNLEAEQLLEAALDLEDNKNARPEQKVEAWCALAKLRENNPYLSKAAAACEEWRAFSTAIGELERSLSDDFSKLSGYLRLKRIAAKQKLAAVDAFLSAYKQLVWSQEVKAVSGARSGVAAGKEVNLPEFAAGGPAAPPSFAKMTTERKSGLVFVRIPAGTFKQGCATGDSRCSDGEKPRRCAVAAFALGQTEVTVDAYTQCVAAGACTEPGEAHEFCTWGGRGNHPVNCVDWQQATKFCSWVGGRLPSASEWEYAAKSGRDVVYPWGNEPVTGRRANYCDSNCTFDEKDSSQNDGWPGPSPVGTYSEGATPWGLLDMAGNVWEWTSSDYHSSKKEVRGGGWDNLPTNLRASYRGGNEPAFRHDGIGFRCAL